MLAAHQLKKVLTPIFYTVFSKLTYGSQSWFPLFKSCSPVSSKKNTFSTKKYYYTTYVYVLLSSATTLSSSC